MTIATFYRFAIICILGLLAFNAQAQTTLTPGDVAFTMFSSSGGTDRFSFVLLKDIQTSTVIRFTDNGWQTTTTPASFRNNEGIFTWTAAAAMTCGTQVTISVSSNGSIFTASAGNAVSISGAFQLATGGDQVFAYQGTDVSPVFIAGVSSTAWATTATSASNSALPAALTNGTTAVSIASIDNGKYNCAVTAGGKTVLDTAVNNSAHWGDSTNAITVPPSCAFSCAAPLDCAGVAGGSASLDHCGVCSGGTTGITPAVDTDGDGTYDCNDLCPNDPNKIAPGICGCGKADTSLAYAGQDAEICIGQQAALLAGGSVNGTYHWSNGPTTAANTVTPGVGTTNYSVTVTNGAGCVTADTVAVTVYALPIANAGNDTSFCLGSSVTITATGGTTYQWSNGVSSAAVTYNGGTGDLIVTVTDLHTCSANDTVHITAKPLPSAFAGNDTAVCQGQTASLTATGGGTYAWIGGPNTANYSVTPTNIGSNPYIVTVTNNGCSKSDTVVVTVNAAPIVTIPNNISTCQGDIITLNAGSFAHYHWSNGDTTSTVIVSAVGSANYYLTVTDANGCTATDTTVATINANPTTTLGADRTICPGVTISLVATGNGTFAWSNGGSTNNNITVSPTSNTNYSVTVTDINNCQGSDTVAVHVYPAPNIQSSADHALCTGDTATVTVVGGVSYSWSTGATTTSISVSPTQTTTYIVAALDSNGCTGSDSTTITVNQLPIVTFTGLAATYCNNAAAVVLTGGPAGGMFIGDGITDSLFSPSAAGGGVHVVSYAFVDANQCAGVATDTVTIDTCVGIATIANNVAVSVHPNPFSGQFVLEIGQTEQPLQATLFDMIGRAVKTNEVTTGTNTFATPASMPAGVYLLEVKGNGVYKTFRLLHAE